MVGLINQVLWLSHFYQKAKKPLLSKGFPVQIYVIIYPDSSYNLSRITL